MVEGRDLPFHHLLDAKQYCTEHKIDPKTIDIYDSKREYERWLELQKLQSDGKISGLRRQVEYELIPTQYERVYVRDKKSRMYTIADGQEQRCFPTKGKALEWCKQNGKSRKDIVVDSYIEPIYKNMVVEQNSVYTADFVYQDNETGEKVVEDVKSTYTRKEKDYIFRRKLMLFIHGIKIREIL